MEKSMQPQVQSEQDKMVPIDTSGEAVEVTLDDNKDKKEQDKVEVQEEQPEIEVKEEKSKDNELEDYSQSVQRRIDKLTKKMREAERREQAAIDYAKKYKRKIKTYKPLLLALHVKELYLMKHKLHLQNKY